MTPEDKQDKKITKEEAKMYYLNWIDELEEQIKDNHPDSKKYAEQSAFLHMAVKNLETGERGLGFFE